MVTSSASPFRIALDPQRVAELRRRVAGFRDLDGPDADDWDYGVPESFLRRFVGYWLDEFDWPAVENRLNQLAHWRATVSDVPVHFIHEPGRGPNPIPLILTHGWPWTFYDYVDLIGPLTDPGAHGGDPADSFDVVIPSLPGFIFSTPLSLPQLNFWSAADVWVSLMRDVLGYERFAAHGGDMGAMLTAQLAHRHASSLIGIHTTSAIPPMAFNVERPWSDVTGGILDGLEGADRQAAIAFERRFAAHIGVQSLAPRTLSYAMSDSPVGLAAWLLEPRYRWSDCAGDVENAFSLEHLATTVMLYAATDSFPSAVRFYSNAWRHQWTPSHDRWPIMEAPTGISWFEHDMPPGDRSAIIHALYNVTYENTHPRGGHFAPVEQPDTVIEDIRATFRPLR